MGIRGRDVRVCAELFRDHMSGITSTIFKHPILIRNTKTQCSLTLGHHADEPVELLTREGDVLYVEMTQELIAEPKPPGVELKTSTYRYAIYNEIASDPFQSVEPIFRWERHEVAAGNSHCRDHFHAGFEVTAAGQTFPLKRLHMPTGVVLIEHVIRFLINDLGVEPECQNWSDVLTKSEEKFHVDFDRARD